jgi:dolichol kinase
MTTLFQNWVLLEIGRIAIILFIIFITSYCVKKERLKVNYSRKIIHFTFIFSALLINQTLFNYSIKYFAISGTISLIAALILVEPIRKRVPIVNFLFLSYDRPEDRPHTVRLTITQIIGANSALIGLACLYRLSGVPLDLLALPLIITAFGDGLAEPIGVRFGKHKYKVKDLLKKRVYIRSYEGSAMVFITTILALIFFNHLFSVIALIFLFAILPLLMTIIEANSPHTWDNPFLCSIGGLILYISAFIA